MRQKAHDDQTDHGQGKRRQHGIELRQLRGHVVRNELLKQLTRAEPDGAPAAPFDGGPIEERPRGGAIGDPNRELAQRMAPQEFAPIKQLGQELTFTIVVPDHRPSLNIPLQGPGAYKITIERRE